MRSKNLHGCLLSSSIRLQTLIDIAGKRGSHEEKGSSASDYYKQVAEFVEKQPKEVAEYVEKQPKKSGRVR